MKVVCTRAIIHPKQTLFLLLTLILQLCKIAIWWNEGNDSLSFRWPPLCCRRFCRCISVRRSFCASFPSFHGGSRLCQTS
ncbi:hypothetical protein BZA77DRAFT_313543 [Pyronema omphalodes]|nr:hypothetical protein BZA77DRAFT_313543 [Pyronema omphalodes]